MKKSIKLYADHVKKTYGERVQKITVDAGLSCPNRDGTCGTGGCSYCNNESFAPVHLRGMSITDQIDHGIRTANRRYTCKKFFVYFQPYSNTHAPLETLKKLYEEALSHPQVVGLHIGTRPDCIDKEKLSYIGELSKKSDITIEYGLESFSDETLKKINRGHNVRDFYEAIKLTKDFNIKICVHMILGFPWETRYDWVSWAKKISELPIDYLKLHQLHILKNTKLGDEYQKIPFKTLSLEEYLDILAEFLNNLRDDIVIQRLFGEAPTHLLLSPDWGISSDQFMKKLLQKL